MGKTFWRLLLGKIFVGITVSQVELQCTVFWAVLAWCYGMLLPFCLFFVFIYCHVFVVHGLLGRLGLMPPVCSPDCTLWGSCTKPAYIPPCVSSLRRCGCTNTNTNTKTNTNTNTAEINRPRYSTAVCQQF